MRPRSVARRLGTFGIGAVVVGAVLVGTGVTVSARAVPHAAAVQPDKKKTTTTTTTTSTLPPTTTTTQPCTAAPTTATSGSASVTMDPGTCIVNGTVVTLTGSGFSPNQPGTFLQCNADGNQPTVMYLGNPIPISCTNPLSKTQGPGVVVTSATGTVSATFTIDTGAVGPPCGPSSCTGVSATDSAGNNTYTDAGKYPCGPPGAFADDSCQITFGDESSTDPSVSVPITFNPNTQPPPATTPTSTPPTGATTATTAASATPAATKASSGSLAFTGTGPGLWWLALVGAVLMVLGVFALVVVDQPRRLVRIVRDRGGRGGTGSP